MKNYRIKIVQSNITGFYCIVFLDGLNYKIDLQNFSVPNMRETEIIINFVERYINNYTFVESDYKVFATYEITSIINGYYKLTKIVTKK